MSESTANPARLYLPLLTHPQAEVREHAGAIFLGTYGDQAQISLRMLLSDPDLDVREQARAALQTLAEITRVAANALPLRDMYVECLGWLRVFVAGREVHQRDWMQLEGSRAGWRKAQGLFAYLVHCGRSGTTREALGQAVWGEPVSASSLSRTLTALRQVLEVAGGPDFAERALVVNRDHCMLAPEVYHTDVQIFERIFNLAAQTEYTHGLAAAVPLYTQTLWLYAGPYMTGVAAGRDWFLERRDLLMNDFVIAAERLAEHAFAQGHYRHCVSYCCKALEADPAADDVTVWLLRAYARLGQYDEAQRAYQRYLRAAHLDPRGAEGRQDAVVCAYHEFQQSRVFGE